VLDRGGIQLVCQRLKNRFAAGAVIRLNSHLDEPVGIEGRIGFFFNRVGQAVRAEHDNGVEVVCFGAVVLALGGGKLYLSHVPIIGAPARWTIGTMKDTITPAAKQGAKTGVKTGTNAGTKAAVKPAVKVDPRAGTKGKKLNKAWLHEHINDPYVKQAQRDGYRARAAYKLKEIDETLGLIKPGNCVVDLGSTPGAWSQYVRRKLSPTGAAVGALNGRIIALDLLPMEPIESVVFIQGDFREADVLQKLEQTLASVNGPVPVDLVISDMAPNLSGIESADAARIAHLVELAVEFAQNRMKPDGALVVKLFHGSGYDELVKLFRATFKTVKPMKPKASRSNSSETFLVGMGLKAPLKGN
jgi:23S rRNA (uridine2552-2'-O)-methyltransferase